jgi:hypothetical protein
MGVARAVLFSIDVLFKGVVLFPIMVRLAGAVAFSCAVASSTKVASNREHTRQAILILILILGWDRCSCMLINFRYAK